MPLFKVIAKATVFILAANHADAKSVMDDAISDQSLDIETVYVPVKDLKSISASDRKADVLIDTENAELIEMDAAITSVEDYFAIKSLL